MRIPRKRVLRIVVNGTDEWTEQAGDRTVMEVQHRLATETIPGAFVRVWEQYLGGAKVKTEADHEGDTQD